MNKLDEQLHKIRKIEVTDVDVLHGKRSVEEKLRAKPTSWIPPIVTACMFVMLCFLIFVPQQQREPQQATIIEEMDIKEFYMLSNMRPNHHLNISSPLYLGKEYVNDQIYLEKLKGLLTQIMVDPQPWDGKTDAETIVELSVNFTDGTKLHLKYDYNVLYDVTNNVQYVNIDNELNHEMWSLFFDVNIRDVGETPTNEKFIIWFILIILLFYLLFDRWYKKRYIELDQNGKRKKLPWLLHFILTLVLISPILFVRYIIGVPHLGYFLIVFSVYLIMYSQLEIRLGVVRSNNIHFKFLLPAYFLVLIVTLIVILVV